MNPWLLLHNALKFTGLLFLCVLLAFMFFNVAMDAVEKPKEFGLAVVLILLIAVFIPITTKTWNFIRRKAGVNLEER